MDNMYQTATQSVLEQCPHFAFDDEDELETDEAYRCENCRYRRWLESGYECSRNIALDLIQRGEKN